MSQSAPDKRYFDSSPRTSRLRAGWFHAIGCLLMLFGGLFPGFSIAADNTTLLPALHLRICGHEQQAPFEDFNSMRQFTGILPAILNQVAGTAGIDMEAVPSPSVSDSLARLMTGECDATILNEQQQTWLPQATLTEPLFKDNAVLYALEGYPFVSSMQELAHVRLALPADIAIARVKKLAPEIVIIPVADTLDALAAVRNGRAELALVHRIEATYLINHQDWYELKISGEIPTLARYYRLALLNTEINAEIQQHLQEGIRRLSRAKLLTLVAQHISPGSRDSNIPALVIGFIGITALLGLLIYWERRRKDYAKKIKIAGERIVKQIADMAVVEREQWHLLERYKILVDNLQEGIIVLQDEQLVFCNPSFLSMVGYAAEEVRLIPVNQLIYPEDNQLVYQLHHERLDGYVLNEKYLLRLRHKQGESIWVEVGGVRISWNDKPAILNFISNVNKRIEHEKTIQFMAHHDSLTGLPNRLLFEDRLKQAVHHAERFLDRVVLMFIDLDRFKPVNDQHGHAIGDQLLQQVASRLTANIRRSDTVARWGGDEFVLLFTHVANRKDILHVANKLLSAVSEPYVMTEQLVLEISCCVGIAVYPDHARQPDELIRIADQAMYQAKQQGRHQVQLLKPLAEQPAFDQVRLEWRGEYASGITALDEEHQIIFTLTNSLLDSIVDNRCTSSTVSRLQTLLDYVTSHFAYEEQSLQQASFTEFQQHQARHAKLLGRGQRLLMDLGTDTQGILTQELIRFAMYDLVYRHLLLEDKKWLPCFSAPAPNSVAWH